MASARDGEPSARRQPDHAERTRRRTPGQEGSANETTEARTRRRARQDDSTGTSTGTTKGGDDGRKPEARLRAAEAGRMAARQVFELTGREPEGVTSIQRSEQGWTVGVEVVESRRIPDTTDILAVYEAELDGDGELISYRRVDRYARGRGNER